MENKDRYLKALIENNGQLNEIDLREKIGLDEDEKREIIARLLSEYIKLNMKKIALVIQSNEIVKRKNSLLLFFH